VAARELATASEQTKANVSNSLRTTTTLIASAKW